MCIRDRSQNVPNHQTSMLLSGHLYAYDASKTAQPELVESSKVSADSKTVTMTLKDAKYSDGTAITADDVVFALARQQGPTGQGKPFFGAVQKAVALDAHTVEWTLSEPMPFLNDLLADHFMMIHPHAQIAADPKYFTHPVSAGPYMIQQYTPGTNSMVLVENPNYVGGPRQVHEIDLVYTADLSSRVIQLQSKDIDFCYDLPYNAPGMLPADVSVGPHLVGASFVLLANVKSTTPIGNAGVRRAISLAIDRANVSQIAFNGAGKPSTGVMYAGFEDHVDSLPSGGKQDIAAAKAELAATPFLSLIHI